MPKLPRNNYVPNFTSDANSTKELNAQLARLKDANLLSGFPINAIFNGSTLMPKNAEGTSLMPAVKPSHHYHNVKNNDTISLKSLLLNIAVSGLFYFNTSNDRSSMASSHSLAKRELPRNYNKCLEAKGWDDRGNRIYHQRENCDPATGTINNPSSKPTKLDDIPKKSILPFQEIKKEYSLQDVANAFKSALTPFESLVERADEIHQNIHGEPLAPETKDKLSAAGKILDKIVELNPKVIIAKAALRLLIDAPINKELTEQEQEELFSDAINVASIFNIRNDIPVKHYKEPAHTNKDMISFHADKKGSEQNTAPWLFVKQHRGDQTYHLPISKSKNENSWAIPLDQYRKPLPEGYKPDDINNPMVYTKPHGEQHEYVRIQGNYYLTEVDPIRNDERWIIGHPEQDTLPPILIKRFGMAESDHWSLVVQENKLAEEHKKNINAFPKIMGEHRLSAVKSEIYTEQGIVEPDENGLCHINGQDYIQGDNGYYPVESFLYHGEKKYWIRIPDRVAHVVKYDAELGCWKMDYLKLHAAGRYDHELTANEREFFSKKLEARQHCYPADFLFNAKYRLKGTPLIADGREEIYRIAPDKLHRLHEILRDGITTLRRAKHNMASPTSESIGIIADYFGVSSEDVDPTLIRKIKNNIHQVENSLHWMQHEKFSTALCEKSSSAMASFDNGYNKIIIYDNFFEQFNDWFRKVVLFHESVHRCLFTEEGEYVKDIFYSHELDMVGRQDQARDFHKRLALGDRTVFQENPTNLLQKEFIKLMKVDSIDQAWVKFTTDKIARINMLLNNPDSVADLCIDLAEQQADDRR